MKLEQLSESVCKTTWRDRILPGGFTWQLYWAKPLRIYHALDRYEDDCYGIAVRTLVLGPLQMQWYVELPQKEKTP